jgi:hypothetical protein
MSIESPVTRIELADDVLISDAEFCRAVLGGVNRRTARRYERDGLPFVMLGGKKYRPLGQGRAWLAGRITVREVPRRRRLPNKSLT